MHLALPDFMAALPEIFLAAASLALLILGAFQGDKAARGIAWLAVSALTLIMAMRFNEREGIARPEYAVLVLLSTTGMMMMIAANDLISLYVSLELQSLALYA